jgi:predicted Rossmann fold flavoprotein
MKGSIGGPIALTISSLINQYDYRDIDLELDFKPSLTKEMLDARIKRDIEDLKKKPNSNAFILVRGLAPNGLIQLILKRTDIDSNLKIKFITQEHIDKIAETLKAFKLNYQGLDNFNKAIITKGGIDVKELNPQTMESKKISGLYFVGEVIDVDAYTGGFNMQIALSTGFACGKAI